MKLFQTLLFAGAAALLLWQSGAIGRLTGENISPREAMTLLEQRKAILVDVREATEVADGILSGARWIPLSGIESGDAQTVRLIDELRAESKQEGREVIVYCRSGARASRVASRWNSEGLRVRNLGGFEAAKAAGMKSEIPEAR